MSDRIRLKWDHLAQEKRKGLIPYVTPEYPVRFATVPVLRSLEKSGADLIEVGIPFSDPLADGPTIQASSEKAIQNGATIPLILDRIGEFRTSSELPILLMGYVNPILRFGVERFMKECASAGIDGLIIPDLPPEESAQIEDAAKTSGLSMVFLIAPTSSDERIRTIDGLSSDFSYCVSVTGVTGARDQLGNGLDLNNFLLRVKKIVKKRFVVGFGISNSEQVAAVWRSADGAVVGSALIKAISGTTDPTAAASAAGKFLASIRPNGASL